MYPQLSPAGDRLAFIHSDPASFPDVWVVDTGKEGEPRRLTDSMTPELRAFPWQTPQIVSYHAKDGLLIRARRFLPRPFDRTATYPAIIQVHEASRLNQEVFFGPGPQKDHTGWYAWHQRLADRGYVVLNIDYRGSFGYGRDFRTADYLAMGSAALDDVVSGVDYLRTLGYVDMSRIGLCGLSAGGRMVVSVLARYPDLARAGIDLAGISDYLIEGGPWDRRSAWVMARLGTPDLNPDAYYEASPVNFLDGIKAPLLILHGTADANVTPAQSFKLVDELLRLNKTFDFELYPGEVHYFARRSSWLDAYRKMEGFLDAHLR